MKAVKLCYLCATNICFDDCCCYNCYSHTELIGWKNVRNVPYRGYYLKHVRNSNYAHISVSKIIFNSPRSSVTFISFQPLRPPLQQILSLTSKPFVPNIRYLGKIKYTSGEIYRMTFPWPWSKVTVVTFINTHPFTTTISRYIPLSCWIPAWILDKLCWKLFWWIVFQNFRYIFQGQPL